MTTAVTERSEAMETFQNVVKSKIQDFSRESSRDKTPTEWCLVTFPYLLTFADMSLQSWRGVAGLVLTLYRVCDFLDNMRVRRSQHVR